MLPDGYEVVVVANTWGVRKRESNSKEGAVLMFMLPTTAKL